MARTGSGSDQRCCNLALCHSSGSHNILPDRSSSSLWTTVVGFALFETRLCYGQTSRLYIPWCNRQIFPVPPLQRIRAPLISRPNVPNPHPTTTWTTKRSRTNGAMSRIAMASDSVGTRFQAPAWLVLFVIWCLWTLFTKSYNRKPPAWSSPLVPSIPPSRKRSMLHCYNTNR